ncbi:MAG TPA: ABC transporter permease [Streptosporangiaceae bacterium]|jgi:NitT/TauT family transport system permease protein|nr:ABC transporter permease [Streptosporangiaceae bacterium]HEX2818911.1 ABC transporter permease [Streptosporangiaceae bacterium]
MPADQPEAKTVPVYAEKLAWLEAQEAPEAPGQRGRTLAKRAWTSLWPKVLAIIIVLAIWELIHISGWKKDIFPGPGGTLANLGDQLNWTKTGLLWHAIGTTSERAVIGFGLAVLIGAVVGALVSRIGPLRAAVGSLITGLQTMPSIAWFPFAIILFGVSTTAILFVIVLGAAPSIANGLIAGVDYTPPILLRAGATMGLRRFALYRHLILPASLPALVAGLRQGWAFAWRSLMAGELLVIIANQPSLGVLLSTDQDQADMQSATAIIIVILVIGILVHTLFSMADRAIRRRWGLVGSSS